MQFPDLVALSIDLTRGNCSSVWSMDHLETLEISLIEPGSPPQPTWKLPALRSLSVMTVLCRKIEGLEPFFDVHGPRIHSFAVSSSCRYGASEIPGTWWPLLPHLDTLHLGYNICLYPYNPPISIRHIYLHSSFPAEACHWRIAPWFDRHFNGQVTAHITKRLSSILLVDRADDFPPRPPLRGQDAIRVYGTKEDNTLLAWYLDLDSAGIRLEGPDGFSCDEVLSQSTARDFWMARKEWARGILKAVLVKNSVICC